MFYIIRFRAFKGIGILIFFMLAQSSFATDLKWTSPKIESRVFQLPSLREPLVLDEISRNGATLLQYP